MRDIEYWHEMRIAIESIDSASIDIACEAISICQTKGGQLFIGGNGGSFSTAEHASCDLSKGLFLATGRRYQSLCLGSNLSQFTAWANDYGYETAMANILDIHASESDALMLITGSGNSKNLINAATIARKKGMTIIGLTGFSGGDISKFLDVEVRVSSTDMQIIENIHLSIIHLIFKILSSEQE